MLDYLDRNDLTGELYEKLYLAVRGVHVYRHGEHFSWSGSDRSGYRIEGGALARALRDYSTPRVGFGALVDETIAAGASLPWDGADGQSPGVYPEECEVPLENGGIICTESAANGAETGVTYVRVCDAMGVEIMYWSNDEWAEDPASVMGAILGSAYGTIA